MTPEEIRIMFEVLEVIALTLGRGPVGGPLASREDYLAFKETPEGKRTLEQSDFNTGSRYRQVAASIINCFEVKEEV